MSIFQNNVPTNPRLPYWTVCREHRKKNLEKWIYMYAYMYSEGNGSKQ